MAAQGAFPTTGNHQLADVSAPAASLSHPTTYRPLPDGDGATFMTLDAMVDAVHGRIGPDYSGFRDPYIVKFANDLYDKTLGQHIRERVASLFNWVIANIAYEPHPINQQVLQDAKRTLELRKADCVSLSVLLATLLAALDYSLTSRFVAQWVDGEEASHVYVEVHMPDGEWLALDAVAKDQPIGWRQPTLDGGFELPWEIF